MPHIVGSLIAWKHGRVYFMLQFYHPLRYLPLIVISCDYCSSNSHHSFIVPRYALSLSNYLLLWTAIENVLIRWYTVLVPWNLILCHSYHSNGKNRREKSSRTLELEAKNVIINRPEPYRYNRIHIITHVTNSSIYTACGYAMIVSMALWKKSWISVLIFLFLGKNNNPTLPGFIQF